jgi:hypothetical protein
VQKISFLEVDHVIIGRPVAPRAGYFSFKEAGVNFMTPFNPSSISRH